MRSPPLEGPSEHPEGEQDSTGRCSFTLRNDSSLHSTQHSASFEGLHPQKGEIFWDANFIILGGIYMIKKVSLYGFKGFEQIDVPINRGVTLLVGPNNSGKSSVLQGVLLGCECLRLMYEDNRLAFTTRNTLELQARKHKGMTLDAFTFFQVAKFSDLWLVGTSPVSGGHISLTFHNDAVITLKFGLSVNLFRFKVARVQGTITREMVEEIATRPVILVPSFAGISSQEERKTHQRIKSLIAKGHFNEVVRNLLYELSRDQQRYDRLKERLRTYFQIEDLRVQFNPHTDEYITAQYRVTRILPPGNGRGNRNTATRTYWLDIASLGLGTLQMLQMITLATQQDPWLILLDEPDSHMHAQLQGRVVDLLNELTDGNRLRIMAATHSKDMINRVDVRRLLRFDNKTLEAVATDDTQRAVYESLGWDNYDLASMFRGSRLAVVEGSTDADLLAEMLKIYGWNALPNRHNLKFYPAGNRASVLSFTPTPLAPLLGTNPIALYDRDYVHSETHHAQGIELAGRGVNVFPLDRKEIENCFLQPSHIVRAAIEVQPGFVITEDQVTEWINESCEAQKDDVKKAIHVAYITYPPERLQIPGNPQRQLARLYEAAEADFQAKWHDQAQRWALVNGKMCLRHVNGRLTDLRHRGMNVITLAKYVPFDDLPPDFQRFLTALQQLLQ